MFGCLWMICRNPDLPNCNWTTSRQLDESPLNSVWFLTSFIDRFDMSGSFRISVWDPPLIISQIIAVQCFMYVSLGLWTVFFVHMIAGQPLSVDYIFRYQVICSINLFFSSVFLIIVNFRKSMSKILPVD